MSEGSLLASVDFPGDLTSSSHHTPPKLIVSGWKGGGEPWLHNGGTLVIEPGLSLMMGTQWAVTRWLWAPRGCGVGNRRPVKMGEGPEKGETNSKGGVLYGMEDAGDTVTDD